MSIQQNGWSVKHHSRPIPADSDPEINPPNLRESLQRVDLRNEDEYASELRFSDWPLRDPSSPYGVFDEELLFEDYIIEDEITLHEYIIDLMNRGLRDIENIGLTLNQLTGSELDPDDLNEYLIDLDYVAEVSEGSFKLKEKDSLSAGRNEVLRQVHDNYSKVLENSEKRMYNTD